MGSDHCNTMDSEVTLSAPQKAALISLVRMAALRVHDMLPKLQPEGLGELTEVGLVLRLFFFLLFFASTCSER